MLPPPSHHHHHHPPTPLRTPQSFTPPHPPLLHSTSPSFVHSRRQQWLTARGTGYSKNTLIFFFIMFSFLFFSFLIQEHTSRSCTWATSNQHHGQTPRAFFVSVIDTAALRCSSSFVFLKSYYVTRQSHFILHTPSEKLSTSERRKERRTSLWRGRVNEAHMWLLSTLVVTESRLKWPWWRSSSASVVQHRCDNLYYPVSVDRLL